jgi:hypothetical protein
VRNLPQWGRLQGELAKISTDSIHLVVPRASHVSLLLNRADAHASSVEILKVVTAARSGTKLQR